MASDASSSNAIATNRYASRRPSHGGVDDLDAEEPPGLGSLPAGGLFCVSGVVTGIHLAGRVSVLGLGPGLVVALAVGALAARGGHGVDPALRTEVHRSSLPDHRW